MNEANEWQTRIDRALRSITDAPTPDGLEMRLERKLRRFHEKGRARRRTYPHVFAAMWMTAAATILVTTSFVLLRKTANQHMNVTLSPASRVAEALTNLAVDSSAPDYRHRTRLAARRLVAPRSAIAHARPHFEQAPPLPLTSQERMMIALARTPGIAFGVAPAEPLSEPGLAENALFELEREPLPPMPSSSMEFSSIPPLPSNLNFQEKTDEP
jgi:hypothetical protein